MSRLQTHLSPALVGQHASPVYARVRSLQVSRRIRVAAKVGLAEGVRRTQRGIMVSVSYMLHGRIRTIPGHGEELAAILPIIDRDSMTSQRLTAIAGIPD